MGKGSYLLTAGIVITGLFTSLGQGCSKVMVSSIPEKAKLAVLEQPLFNEPDEDSSSISVSDSSSMEQIVPAPQAAEVIQDRQPQQVYVPPVKAPPLTTMPVTVPRPQPSTNNTSDAGTGTKEAYIPPVMTATTSTEASSTTTSSSNPMTTTTTTATAATMTTPTTTTTTTQVITPPPPPDVVLPVTYLCSSGGADTGSLASATSLYVRIAPKAYPNNTTCAYTDVNLRNSILADKKLNLTKLNAELHKNCPVIPNNNYTLTIQIDRLGNTLMKAQVVENSNGLLAGVGVTSAEILLDFNEFYPITGKERVLPNVPCDRLESPLIIKMQAKGRATGPLRLSSQRDGVNFDILGEKADPRPHTLKRISWHRSMDYLYITRPDAKGNVRGANELFGNNTRGPDGDFASNGYEALAKFDGMSADGKVRLSEADGYIDANDAIFESLRLWQDANFDGTAQDSELHKMSDFEIVKIDLNFNPNYREVDKYGNETKFKSVVQTKDGRLHLLFDIWFKYFDLK